jgi:invasion protein IalB
VLRSGAGMARVPFRVGYKIGLLTAGAAVVVLHAANAFAEVRPALAAAGNSMATIGPPMRLGVTDAAPRRTDLARLQTPQNNCRKWRRIAERLGETFAGLRLRQSVVDRACLFAATELASVTGGTNGADTSFDHLWAWPWADGAIDPSLPPRLHTTHGDWHIRCGQAGRRERCALIHETVAVRRADAAVRDEPGLAQAVVLVTAAVNAVPPDSATLEPATPDSATPDSATPDSAAQDSATPDSAAMPQNKIVTHFVIDTIGGHAHVVWRVFVERAHVTTLDHGTDTGATRPELVRFSSGTMSGAKRFDVCSSAGCLMEADMTTSARLATRLWEGQNGGLTFNALDNAATGVTLSATISAKGVRAGLAELARLKRSEDKVLARH